MCIVWSAISSTIHNMRIGLFGGSFNPIHYGHIRLARQLLALAALDEVWFVVSPQNPLKQQNDLLDDDLRLQMVEMALQREKGLWACDIEFRLPRPSYTWNTLQTLRQEHPDDEFTLLIGGDNWERFPLWYRADDIVRDYDIVVYPRTGSDIDERQLPPTVRIVRTRRINISSTMIRQRIALGQTLSRLVPKAVADFIEKKRLYASL